MLRSCFGPSLLLWASVLTSLAAADASPARNAGPAVAEVIDRVVLIRSKAEPDRQPPAAVPEETPESGGPDKSPRRPGAISGTGFFLGDGDRTYLVTARHVAVALVPNAELSFLNSRRDSRTIRLAGVLRGPEDFRWRHHETADVSLIQVYPRGEPSEDVAALCVERDALLASPPARGSQAMACGFFMREGTHQRLAPLVATVHVASEVMPVAFNGKLIDAFLVNPPAGSGFSGGPVYWHDAESGRPRCIGVTSGVIGDQSGGKFSTVMPCSTILDLLK